MPETIYIGQDMATAETKVLFDRQDFVNLVDERMGSDAARYIENLIDEMDEQCKGAYEEGLNDAWSSYDAEEYNNGREDGYEEGHTAGYAAGYAEGFEAGYKHRNPWA